MTWSRSCSWNCKTKQNKMHYINLLWCNTAHMEMSSMLMYIVVIFLSLWWSGCWCIVTLNTIYMCIYIYIYMYIYIYIYICIYIFIALSLCCSCNCKITQNKTHSINLLWCNAADMHINLLITYIVVIVCLCMMKWLLMSSKVK